MRYFKKDDAELGETIKTALNDAGLPVNLVYVPGFENSTHPRPKHYELWMARPSGA